MIRVLVCGGRDYQDRRRTFAELALINEQIGIDCIVHGACKEKGSWELRGADRWAQEWAQTNGIPYIGHPARWGNHGRAGGPIRNGEMLRKWLPDYVLAMPGGAGTADMVRQAEAAGVEVVRVAAQQKDGKP